MRQLVEGFIIILLIGIIAFSSLGWINMNMQTANARQFLQAATKKIETSEYNPETMGACQEKAKERNYELIIKDESYTDGVDTKPCYRITLKYKVNNPLFRIVEESTLSQYTR